jgi:hypothetical protein
VLVNELPEGEFDLVHVRCCAFEPHYGRPVAGDLAAAGLVEVNAEGRVAMWRGGEDGGRIWRLTIEPLREEIASGVATADDIHAALALCDDPQAAIVSQITMAAWGRRPG